MAVAQGDLATRRALLAASPRLRRVNLASLELRGTGAPSPLGFARGLRLGVTRREWVPAKGGQAFCWVRASTATGSAGVPPAAALEGRRNLLQSVVLS